MREDSESEKFCDDGTNKCCCVGLETCPRSNERQPALKNGPTCTFSGCLEPHVRRLTLPVMSGSQLGVAPFLCQDYRTAHVMHVARWVSKVYFGRAAAAAAAAVARTVAPHTAFSAVFHEAALGGATGQRASCN